MIVVLQITAVSFDPSGQNVVGGLLSGQVYFYSFDMKYITQISCRNKWGKYNAGKKVTGINFINKDSYNISTDEYNYRPKVGNLREKLIITTNDSRIRLVQTEDYSLVHKYCGLINTSMQIKASLSDDNKYIICGSEDGKVFIWHTFPNLNPKWKTYLSKHNSHTNQSYENFQASQSVITAAIFAPSTCFYHSLIGHRNHHFRYQVRQSSDLLQIDFLKAKVDPILINHNIDSSNVPTNIIVAADYDGKVRIYLRQNYMK